MPNTRRPSPARSQGPQISPRRNKPRRTRSVGSPARSAGSGRLSNIVDQFKENNKDSFAVSPLSKAVLSDNTEIEMPRRRSWWKKVERSRDVINVLEDEQMGAGNMLEELDVEVLSQEKENYSLDLPESSGSETINSIVIPQRKFFIEKENKPQKFFGEFVGTKHNKIAVDEVKPGTSKKLFDNAQEKAGLGKRTKPFFPSTLLATPDKTLISNKTKEFAAELNAQPKALFGNRPKRKNVFADFIVSESEDEIPEIQAKVFTFPKKSEQSRRSSATTSRGVRESSPASSVTTDIEMDDWKLLPSSTMVENQIEANLVTPGKRARLSKLSEAKESNKTNSTKQSNTSESSKNKSFISQAKNVIGDEEIPDIVTEVAKDISNVRNQTMSISKSKNDETKKSNKSASSKNKSNVISPSKNDRNNEDSLNLIEGAKEISNLRNETYDKNKTITKQLSQSKNYEIKQSNQSASSKNKSNVISPTKNVIVNEETSNTVTEDAKEISNVRNKTYNINKTMTKELSKSKNHDINEDEMVEVQQDKGQKEKPNFESEPAPEDGEEITLTYDDNDPEELPENNNQANKPFDDKTKTICVDNRLSKVSEYIDNIEIELSKLVGEEEQKVVEMETPIPNKSVHLTNKVVEETPGSEIGDKSAQSHAEEIAEKEVKVYQMQAQVEEKTHSTKERKSDTSNSNKEDITTKQTNGVQKATESNKLNAEGAEVSNDDNAKASQVNDASDQDDDDEEKDDEVIQENESQEEDEEMEIEVENDEQSQKDEEEDEEADEEEEVDSEAAEASEEEFEVQDENVETEEDDENKSIVSENEQNEEQDEDEVENENQEDNDEEANDDEAEENNLEDEAIEASDDAQDTEKEDQAEELHETELQQTEIESDTNASHDTTGRNRKIRETNTPEIAVMKNLISDNDSFTTKQQSTMRKTKSMTLKNVSLRPSVAPTRESTGLSDGITNSSAEGSGWDSHRTTRKTLRQTFGKDFTPRKSLRALVMEKSAKRQTAINEANAQLKFHQANSTELPNDQDEQEEFEDNVEVSNHDISEGTKQAMIYEEIEKVREENKEFMRKIAEQCQNALKPNAPRAAILMNFRAPTKGGIRRANPRPIKAASKPKRAKLLDQIPAEFLEDMQYKPPKRFKPSNASWITKRLYKFLETKLEPKYDYKARVRAEKLVETIYTFVREIKRLKLAPAHSVAELGREMARLEIVHTYFEFYDFINEYMPYEVKIKVVPDIINDLPMPRGGVFASILE